MRALIFLFILLSGITFGQEINQLEPKMYSQIIKSAQRVPAIASLSTYYLAEALTAECSNDFEKAFSFYVWISNNITYDIVGFKSGNFPDYRPKAVLYNKEAVCEGYANLFKDLCDEAGVRCEVIQGYSKGYGYIPGQTFTMANHSWNAIFIDDTWYLVDVTWAARKLNNSPEKRAFTDAYFLTPPENFIKDHLPEIPAWQLLKFPITKEAFETNSGEILADNYNYSDSLAHYLKLNSHERTISHQLQVRAFNPGNDDANYKLAVEYRFKGLDFLEKVYDVPADEIQRFDQLEKVVFSNFDEAALYFSLIKPNSSYYESAQVFLDDTDFERGVFKYEVAHRLLEIYNTFSPSEKTTHRSYYENAILDNYRNAAIYFERIPRHSWYYDKAQDYLKKYLKNPFKESTLVR
jgi:hypothetical protein